MTDVYKDSLLVGEKTVTISSYFVLITTIIIESLQPKCYYEVHRLQRERGCDDSKRCNILIRNAYCCFVRLRDGYVPRTGTRLKIWS